MYLKQWGVAKVFCNQFKNNKVAQQGGCHFSKLNFR